MIANSGKLAGHTLFVTGASRGIGKAIALKAAKDGANVVVAAKTSDPHPKLPGTIFTAAKEIESAGGKALPCIVDVRDEVSIQAAVDKAIGTFGGIDILINNASAISLTGTEGTSMKKYDLMHQINTRGTYLTSKLCLPHLTKSKNPHILNLSPPLNMNPLWFKNHVAYTMAKYGMSMCVLGMAEEFKPLGIAVNAIWPRTAIITAAMEMLGGSDIAKQCRKPEIMSDAAYAILCRDSKTYTGNFAIDDEVLKAEGITDFSSYAFDPTCKNLMPDFFLDEFDYKTTMGGSMAAPAAETAAGGDSGANLGSGEIDKVFKGVENLLDADVIKQTKAVFVFDVTGDESGRWFMDLKNEGGQIGRGDPPTKVDATFTLNNKDFVKLFDGTLKPTSAFMMGKLKIAGDMGKALKLEKLMGKMKSKL